VSFHRILIANRGEIACRVMRTARALGYRTVAVFSDADAGAPHVRAADEAVCIGPAPASESYLRVDRLIDAAQRTGADAVHPGYGFLAERADFARACEAAGLVFIGPPPAAITAMGDKAGAKRRLLAAGVPCAPGYLGEDQSDERLTAEAGRVGFPLLVKAVAGGGGRGMRLVRSTGELAAALAGARREATSAFGDGTLMLERLIEKGRHIEIQVFADRHGHALHLGERDCTAQRRRQKVIEEAPSPVVSQELRARMGADAVAAAVSVGYVGAGTVEFIVDDRLDHYFLEMNTRLQVEHPVTECITGLDLVEWQLRVAAGEPLPLAQDEIHFEGHAIEARLYAEDPYDGFAPQTGRVLHWRPAAALRPGVRIDSGIAEGGEVTPHYDAMAAKIIAHGRDRADAIRRLTAAITDAPLVGPRNNARFLCDLLGHPAFTEGRLHTSLLDEWAEANESLFAAPTVADTSWQLAAAVLAMPGGGTWRPASVAAWDLTLRSGDARRTLRVRPTGRRVEVGLEDSTATIEILERQDHMVRFAQESMQRAIVCIQDGDSLHLVVDGGVLSFQEVSAWPNADSGADPRFARAPVAGSVAAVSVAAGDRVEAGQPLICVEAMKMEMWLHARSSGRVAAVNVACRDSVDAGAVLVVIDIEETA
jgi:acetyl-CoA carboxylase biotin carboxylase subunit